MTDIDTSSPTRRRLDESDTIEGYHTTIEVVSNCGYTVTHPMISWSNSIGLGRVLATSHVTSSIVGNDPRPRPVHWSVSFAPDPERSRYPDLHRVPFEGALDDW